MNKLFVIYIGGIIEGAFIELHDMRFLIADKIENTYDSLRESWWGTPKSLHLDAWGPLESVDGYDIEIHNKPQNEIPEKLFFINLGGYDPLKFTELHENIFVVAEDAIQAKRKALERVKAWTVPHRDYQYEVDTVIDIADIASAQKHFIHLIPSSNVKNFTFECEYKPIGI